MITQQQIVNQVRRLTVGYNVSWYDIMLDADMAIYKINERLGAKYPPMSDIMRSPDATYTIKGAKIFKDEYIISIVIPYIAMQILARDEEFTTIYNKYATDVEDGLFTMFQNEYNKVPEVFRQGDDVGVFFEHNYPGLRVRDDINGTTKQFHYRVYYHYENFNFLKGYDTFYVDEAQYPYGTEIQLTDIKGCKTLDEHSYISNDLLKIYIFDGWKLNNDYNNHTIVGVGETITITDDIHLYPTFKTKDIYKINNDGLLELCSTANNNLLNDCDIILPKFINGKTVVSICTDSIYSKAKSITIPATVRSIDNNTFANFTGSDVYCEIPCGTVQINTGAFNLENSKVKSIVIPRQYEPYNADIIFNGKISNKLKVIFKDTKNNSAWDNNKYFDTSTTEREFGYNG